MKIAIVGEAWGEAEEQMRAPFVGASGHELTRMLDDAGIRRADCFLTNVFNLRPRPSNDISNLCAPKKEAGHSLPPIATGKYIRREYLPELERLAGELAECRPNVVVALGGTAAWALLGTAGISKIRGTAAVSSSVSPTGVEGLKVLPTYHPAAVLRDWSLRAITVMDLMKAKREAEFPELRRPRREVWIEPTLADLDTFFERYLKDAKRISYDIETYAGQVTCIGFAPSKEVAMVVPFVCKERPDQSYWPEAWQEVAAWKWVRKVLNLPCEKVGQNALYDMNYLWQVCGLTVAKPEHDTMLLAHAMQPELPKGLGFLASVYTNEASWKLMRGKEADTMKREDV